MVDNIAWSCVGKILEVVFRSKNMLLLSVLRSNDSQELVQAIAEVKIVAELL